ncbi:hypothetical protein O0L34_g18420 [Tuta absoluta]|nr:hypothetical protein O0L34_g18420 [Tuta absoluta]
MAFKVALSLGLLHLCAALPALTLQDLEVADDTMAVGSYIREVRAAKGPDDYHRTYENEGDGEIGYSRKKGGGGKKGYQHFDSYHKKAGDNYEFEKQDSFGHDDGDDKGAYSHRHEQRASPQQSRKHRRAEYEEPESERVEEADHELIEERKNKNPKKVKHYEELKEGASDGNGGLEAYGHDPRDYVLPERYVWGDEE